MLQWLFPYNRIVPLLSNLQLSLENTLGASDITGQWVCIFVVSEALPWVIVEILTGGRVHAWCRRELDGKTCTFCFKTTDRKWVWAREKVQLDSCCGPVTRLEGLLPSFADVVSEFGDALFLLFQGIQDNAHWRLLQTYSLHFIFQLVLEVSKSQGCMDEHHWKKWQHQRENSLYMFLFLIM